MIREKYNILVWKTCKFQGILSSTASLARIIYLSAQIKHGDFFLFWVFYRKSVIRSFLSHWIRIWCQNLIIKNGGSNMLNENAKSNHIWIKLSIRGFSRSLITNLNAKFRNLKWWIFYGGSKCKKLLLSDETVLGSFWVRWLWIWTQNSEIQNGGSNMVDQNPKRCVVLDKNRYSGVFRLLIMNLERKFGKSKLRIQYGGPRHTRVVWKVSDLTMIWDIFS